MPYTVGGAPSMTTPDGQALAKYVDQEFAAIASSQVANVVSLPLSPIFAPPSRSRTGTIVYADGVKWNPGSGEGTYEFGSDGNWHFLAYGATPGHIVGEPGNGSAASGEVGEWGDTGLVTISFGGSATPQNITSILVPAGDFDIQSFVEFGGPGATFSSNWNTIVSSSSTPSISSSDALEGIVLFNRFLAAGDQALCLVSPSMRISQSAPALWYLHAQVTITGSYGATGKLRYRRMR